MANDGTLSESAITGGTVAVLVDGPSIAWDCSSSGLAYDITLGGDRHFNSPTGLNPGQIYVLKIVQDGIGTRLVSWGAGYKFEDGTPPVLSTAASAIDVLLFYSDGVTLGLLSISKNIAPSVAAPINLTASTDETGQVTLGWENLATDATSIRVQRDDGLGFTDIATIGPTDVSYIDTITPGTYPYRVVAYRGSSASAPSNTATGVSN